MLIELNNDNFQEELDKGLKLVEFYTSWCGYCKKQLPELEQMDKIWIGQINAEKSPQIAAQNNVNAFPTFLIFKDGREADRFSGYRTKEEIMEKIMQFL